jgi:predicted nuclease with TOPRIM domain
LHELDNIQANKAKTQEVQAVRDELSTKLSSAQSETKQAEERATEVEARLAQVEEDLQKVRFKFEIFMLWYLSNKYRFVSN